MSEAIYYIGGAVMKNSHPEISRPGVLAHLAYQRDAVAISLERRLLAWKVRSLIPSQVKSVDL